MTHVFGHRVVTNVMLVSGVKDSLTVGWHSGGLVGGR
jgi:hypothetical protein